MRWTPFTARLAAAVLFWAIADQASAAVLPMPAHGTMVHWDKKNNPDPQSYIDGRLTLTLSSRCLPHKGVGAALEVAEGGDRKLEIVGPDGYSFAPADFVIARLDADADGPSVLLATYTGGAHCCADFVVAELVGGSWRKVWVGEFDADVPEQVVDLDGDGVADIVMVDDAFDYGYASFAGSYRPPAVFNLRAGRVWNVSAEPKYRKLFERDLARTQAVCVSGDPQKQELNGACAAFVADAARLQRLDWAWPIMLAHYDRASGDRPVSCRVSRVKGVCPKGQVLPLTDYPKDLRAFLVQTGYIRAHERPLDTLVQTPPSQHDEKAAPRL